MARRPPKHGSDVYNTREIVMRLARDRRRSVGVFFAALVAVAAIAVFFLFQPQRPSTSPPSMVYGAPAGTQVAIPGEPAVKGPTSVLTTNPAPPPPVPPTTVRLQMSASKAAPMWLDGKALGVRKQAEMQVSPGDHEVKTRFGKKTLVETVHVAEGTPMVVWFDAKKKKTSVMRGR